MLIRRPVVAGVKRWTLPVSYKSLAKQNTWNFYYVVDFILVT